MAIPAPVTGGKIPASDVLFGLGGGAGRKATFRAHLAAAVTATTAVALTIKFDTVDEDTDSAYSTSTGLFTCVTPGLYVFTTNLTWASNGTGVRTLLMTSTGSPANAQPPIVLAANDSAGRNSAVLVTRLSVGQTVSVQGTQTSGGNLATLSGANVSFAGCLLSL